MILWLNGAFGAGKTAAAEALCRRLPGSYLYDPERVGYFLRENLPGPLCPWEDFQEDPLWRQFNAALLERLAKEHPGPVVVPMTVVSPAYWAQLTGGIPRDSLGVFVLWAERETLEKRLAGRGDGPDSWPARQIPRCCRDLKAMPGRPIPTDRLTAEQIADIIFNAIS